VPYARPAAPRVGNGNINNGQRVAPSGRGMLKYTRTRPTLAWREGPGAASA
jgi:hypothetical protein